jgi:hypothetical protein
LLWGNPVHLSLCCISETAEWILTKLCCGFTQKVVMQFLFWFALIKLSHDFIGKCKMIPLHAMEALGVRGGIAPPHS